MGVPVRPRRAAARCRPRQALMAAEQAQQTLGLNLKMLEDLSISVLNCAVRTFYSS